MTENTLSTMIILGAFIAGATMFCLAIYREMQEREAQRTKEAVEHRRFLKERAQRWKDEQARVHAIWVERGKVIRPRFCSEIDEREPLN
jgi:hypothetical protein